MNTYETAMIVIWTVIAAGFVLSTIASLATARHRNTRVHVQRGLRSVTVIGLRHDKAEALAENLIGGTDR